MSRYSFSTDKYDVAVGYDNPMSTFFLQAYKSPPGEDEEEPDIYFGIEYDEVPTVEKLVELAAEKSIVIPGDILAQIKEEGANPKPLTPLQEFVRNGFVNKPLFSLGTCVITPGAISALEESEQAPSVFLGRHVRGDWGNVCPEDAQSNTNSLKFEQRLLSSYETSKGVRLWVITEWDRSVTTILLPSEY